ncbi:MAG: hypothetical protein JSW61_04280 [Candidatus Thorarchaeota archaeon]|nr:MAG: hypothetical protein JSW61_04280 [Candidatus Thorarchaeota archaeon]
MTVVRGIIREVGPTRTRQVSARRWTSSTEIVIQDESTMKTYSVHVSGRTLQKSSFLPRVGIQVVVHGYVEEAEYGISDFVVTRVVSIKHVGADRKRTIRFDDVESEGD